MAIYSARVRLSVGNLDPRGSGYAEHVAHFTADDDDTAGNAAEAVAIKVADGAISQRWIVQRETEVHEVAIFRRSIENRRTWTPIRTFSFPIGGLFEAELELPIDEVPINVAFRQAHVEPNPRRAVLVRLNGAVAGMSRRVYVGPIAPVAAVLTGSIGIPFFGDELTHIWARDSPLFGVGAVRSWTYDYPADPAAPAWDIVPESLASIAASHMSNLLAGASGCTQKIVSWKNGTTSSIATIDTSQVWAELRSRASRRPMRRWEP